MRLDEQQRALRHFFEGYLQALCRSVSGPDLTALSDLDQQVLTWADFFDDATGENFIWWHTLPNLKDRERILAGLHTELAAQQCPQLRALADDWWLLLTAVTSLTRRRERQELSVDEHARATKLAGEYAQMRSALENEVVGYFTYRLLERRYGQPGA